MFIELMIYDEPAFFTKVVLVIFLCTFFNQIIFGSWRGLRLKEDRHYYDQALSSEVARLWSLSTLQVSFWLVSTALQYLSRYPQSSYLQTGDNEPISSDLLRRRPLRLWCQTSRGTLEQRSPEERSTGEARSCRALLLQKVLGHTLL